MSVPALILSPQASQVVVFGIDVGTSGSGCVYAFPHEPENVYSLLKKMEKVGTHILLDENLELVAFGDEAFTRYRGQAKRYYFFERFKMQLYRENKLLHERPTITSCCGRQTVSVVEAFAIVFRFFKKKAEELFATQAKGYSINAAHWIVTVPAIWSDGAKQVMREAADEAKLGRVSVCLEPTAASLWVFRAFSKQEAGLNQPGTHYLTIDAGGGTVDILAFRSDDNKAIVKLASESGGDWGSTKIDDEFVKLLSKCVGDDIWEEFKQQCPECYRKILKEFESIKRCFNVQDIKDNDAWYHVEADKLASFLDSQGLNAEELINANGESLGIRWEGDIALSAKALSGLFNSQIKLIINHIKGMLKSFPLVKYLLLVGGFGESDVLEHILQQEFVGPGKCSKLLRPPNAGASIMCGAVIFGQNQKIVRNLISDATYGICTTRQFKAGDLPEKKYLNWEKKEFCNDVFSTFIKRNESYELNHSVTHSFTTSEPDQKVIAINVYCTRASEVKYVTDAGCVKLGFLDVDVPIPKEMEQLSKERLAKREVLVNFHFESEQLQVTVTPTYIKGATPVVRFFNFLD